MKGDGYTMGTHRVSESGKAITMHFRKWNAHACRHFAFHNALHHFMVCSVVQASGGIQPQPSRFGPDEISAAAAAARFTCQYGSRNGSRPVGTGRAHRG